MSRDVEDGISHMNIWGKSIPGQREQPMQMSQVGSTAGMLRGPRGSQPVCLGRCGWVGCRERVVGVEATEVRGHLILSVLETVERTLVFTLREVESTARF